MSKLTDYDPCGARSRPSGRFTCDRRPHPGDGPHQALVPDRMRGTYRVLTWNDDSGDVTISPTLLAVPEPKRHKGACSSCGRLCVCDSRETKAAAHKLFSAHYWHCRGCGRGDVLLYDGLCSACGEHAHLFNAAT